MHPIFLQGDGWLLSSWHVFYVLAAIFSWRILHLMRPHTAPELSARDIDHSFLITYVFGYFGARILSIVVEKEYRSEEFSWLWSPLNIGSMTLYGGMILGTLALFLWSRRKGFSFLRVADLYAVPLLIAVFIGRIGCFLNGDDYGKPIADQLNPSWWAVQFPNLGDSVYRYPVQLWESLVCGVLAMCILWLARNPRADGRLADIAVYGYAVGRILLEQLRGDERGYFLLASLSTSQGISLIVIIIWGLGRSFKRT